MLKIDSGFLNSIKEAQKVDVKLVDLLIGTNQTKDSDNDEMKKMILEESHRSSLSIHPRATKMYHDLKRLFWWSGLKRDVA